MITLDEAKNLQVGQILHHTKDKNRDGSPRRWRVNGAVKTWKRNPNRVKVPVKHGLYSYDYLTEKDLELVSFPEDRFIKQVKECLKNDY